MISSSLMPNAFAQAKLSTAEDGSPLARKVRVKLRRSSYNQMRRVEVEVAGDVLTLSGVVFSYHMKQLAQEIARKAVDNVTIDNQLMVVSGPKQTPK